MIWTKGWKKKQWEERKRKSKWKKMTKIKKRTLEGGYICPQYKKNFVPSFLSESERLVFGGYKEKIHEFHQNISNFQPQSNNPKNPFLLLCSIFLVFTPTKWIEKNACDQPLLICWRSLVFFKNFGIKTLLQLLLCIEYLKFTVPKLY